MHKPKLTLFAAIGATLLAGLFAGCSHNNAAQTPAAPAATATTTTASSQPSRPQNSTAQQSGPPAPLTPYQRMMENR